MGNAPQPAGSIISEEGDVIPPTNPPEKQGSRFSWFAQPKSNQNSVVVVEPVSPPKKQNLNPPLDIRSESQLLPGSASWSLLTAIDFEPVLCRAELAPNEWVMRVTLSPKVEKKTQKLTFCTNFGNEFMYILDEYDENAGAEPLSHDAPDGMAIEGIRTGHDGIMEFEETPIEELIQKYERDFADKKSPSSEFFKFKKSSASLQKGGGEVLPQYRSASEDSFGSDEELNRFRSTFWLPGSVRKGFFEKRGLLNKSYKRRFFVLAQSSDMYYFTDDGMKNQRGELSICAGTKMDFLNEQELVLQCEDRQWIFRFPSVEERINWSNCIQKVIDNSNVAKGSLIHSGYMLKLGFRRQNWKFRFFKLYHNQVLKYYADENYSSMSGQTNLDNVQRIEAVDGDDEWPFQLNIITPKRTWQFRLRTEPERARWKEVLEDYLDIKEIEETPFGDLDPVE